MNAVYWVDPLDETLVCECVCVLDFLFFATMCEMVCNHYNDPPTPQKIFTSKEL